MMLQNTSSARSLRSLHARANMQTHIVRPFDSGSYALLEEAYDQLFRKYFGAEEYQEPLSKWYKRLEAQDAPSEYIIGISGTDLHRPHARQLSGMFVGIYYKDAQTGLLAYNIVDEEWRGTGLGSHQVNIRKEKLMEAAHKNGKELRGIFAECNNPKIVAAQHDLIPPTRRLEMYAHMGGKHVPIQYTCPSGADIGDKLNDLVLLAFPNPQTGIYPSKQDTIAYLKGCYNVRGLTPEGDPCFERMVKEINTSPIFHDGTGPTWLHPITNTRGRHNANKSSKPQSSTQLKLVARVA